MTIQRDDVVKAALDLLDRVGLAGLTVRRLAAELGVQAPALYWHFSSKQELLDEMVEVLAAELFPPVRPLRGGEDWAEWIGEWARQAHRRRLARANAVLLAASAAPTANRCRQTEVQLAGLCAAGFAPADAVGALLALERYALGFAVSTQPAQGDAAFEAGLRLILNGMKGSLDAGA
jgi:TetR/AcrR family tetracycline transcriptional repressor